MKKINMKIVADSSADVLSLENINFASVPLKIITSQNEYVDNADLNVTQMVEDLLVIKEKSSTACPGIGDWLEAFGDSQYIFCTTITSALSGSYNAAEAAKREYEELHPDRHVFVIDSLSAGPELKLIIEKLQELIMDGKDFEEICTLIKEYQTHTRLLFTLESLTNLANNGRVSRILASAVGILGIRIIGEASAQGKLEQLQKCRGEKKALLAILEQLHSHNYKGKKIRIGHCFNEQAALKLKELILSEFATAQIEIYPMRGLCSYYAEKGGILIGFEIE